jgi:hypothetical protein
LFYVPDIVVEIETEHLSNLFLSMKNKIFDAFVYIYICWCLTNHGKQRLILKV